MSISRVARWTAAVALAIGGLALPGNALAQGATNVADFSCGTTPFSVNVDVRGLGSTDVCVTSTSPAPALTIVAVAPRLRTKPPLQQPLRAVRLSSRKTVGYTRRSTYRSP